MCKLGLAALCPPSKSSSRVGKALALSKCRCGAHHQKGHSIRPRPTRLPARLAAHGQSRRHETLGNSSLKLANDNNKLRARVRGGSGLCGAWAHLISRSHLPYCTIWSLVARLKLVGRPAGAHQSDNKAQTKLAQKSRLEAWVGRRGRCRRRSLALELQRRSVIRAAEQYHLAAMLCH